MTDKTKLQTYNFLSENKSIEDIKKQPNIILSEKRRHGGIAYKLLETNNVNNQIVNDYISENEIFYDALALDDLNIPTNEILQIQTVIQEQTMEIQQLKKQIAELKQAKQGNINFDNFKYNVITIYDEKQRKKIGIEKTHEEILPIDNEIYFITTFQHVNNSFTEEILTFHDINDDNLKVVKQTKYYKNIDEYKNDFNSLIENISTNKNNSKYQFAAIKEFIKQHNDFKIKPSKNEKRIWWIITIISLSLIILTPILTFAVPALIPATAMVLLLETKIVIAISATILGTIFKGATSIFSTATKKVELWWYNKLFKNQEKKDKDKKEFKSIIKNLTSDKIETKLETQFDILKQELNYRKDQKVNELLTVKKIFKTKRYLNFNQELNNHSNNIFENKDFDLVIKNSINQQNQPSNSNNPTFNLKFK